LERPLFFPAGKSLFVSRPEKGYGRSTVNVNWACAKCHAGERPQFAGGMSTWNSTEYSDASRGSCYSQLRCIDCHEPHTGTGKKWKLSESQNDMLCLKCHQEYEPEGARTAHTHHPIGSAGSHCMNCHMPRLNEGMQDVVRTHTIFSPSHEEMIHNNQPNACNMCHTDETIDWTVDHLSDWYGASFSQAELAANYPSRSAAASLNWLQNSFKPVRLVAIDALTRTKSTWAMSHLIDALDDPHLLNRQFAQTGIEQMRDISLLDYGYRYYMTAEERRGPIERLRAKFCETVPGTENAAAR
jgi:predicted CXXCH cytochrome family protein